MSRRSQSRPAASKKKKTQKNTPPVTLTRTTSTSPGVLLALVSAYMAFTCFSVWYLVTTDTLTMSYLMFAPISLAIFMYVWLCLLAWPLRGEFNTVSSSCAQQEHNFLRIILVVLCCLLGTAMSAILVDEFESRNRRLGDSKFIIFEVVACLMLPLTGIFPTVDIPANAMSWTSWGQINAGTPTYAVPIPGFISFALHFLGVLPFMFGLPIINIWYAYAAPPESWVYIMSILALVCLLTFVFFQGAIILQNQRLAFTSWGKDKLFFCSFFAELLLVLFVSLSTLLFSLKRNENIPFDFKFDRRLSTVAFDILSARFNVSSWAELQELVTPSQWQDLINATLAIRKSQLQDLINTTLNKRFYWDNSIGILIE